jgi:predicted enzyme related to lactoylglutathione lyase
MNKINIIIPVENYDELERYYRDVLSFSFQGGLFYLPVETSDVALKLMIVDEEAKADFPPKRGFPIFSYMLEKNFLSYCEKIYKNGALIEMACATPGGYYARVSDLAGNKFEIECRSFEEDDSAVDPSTMPFFFNY